MAREPGSDPAADGPGDGGEASGRAWLASLPAELAAQRRVMTGLLEFCEATPLVTSLSVGCSLGRGAADALSDIDAALGVAAGRGDAGAAQVLAVEAAVTAALPGLGPLVDVLRHRAGPADRLVRRIFAQFADGTQLDLQASSRPAPASTPQTCAARQRHSAYPGQRGRRKTVPGRAALGDGPLRHPCPHQGALTEVDMELPRPVGYVLGGGGSLGAVQVGMLQALAEHGSPS